MTIGGIDFGTALMGLLTPRAPANDILNLLIKDKPEFYKFVDIDMSTARTNQPFDEPGTFIWVDNQFARGEVTLRLNELKFGEFDLRRQKHIQGPFYRFFITNGEGQGVVRLFISRGYQAASEPLEAINRAELAARLGSPVTFDRRGDVVWLEDFEFGLQHWTPTNVTWSAEASNQGGFSAKFNMVVATPAANIVRNIFPFMGISSSHSGLEISWSMPTGVYFQVGLLYYTGGFSYAANVEADDNNLYIYDGATLTTVLTGLNLISAAGDLFHHLKFVVDYENNKWVRAMMDTQQIDLSDYSLKTAAAGAVELAQLSVTCTTIPAADAVAYGDTIIFTQNET